MKIFIEVTFQGKFMLINVNNITAVKSVNEKARIFTVNHAGDQANFYTLGESYEEVKSKIAEAQK